MLWGPTSGTSRRLFYQQWPLQVRVNQLRATAMIEGQSAARLGIGISGVRRIIHAEAWRLGSEFLLDQWRSITTPFGQPLETGQCLLKELSYLSKLTQLGLWSSN